MTKALYRKWRPQVWDEVAGQEHVVQTLRNAVIQNRVAHAYLFAGPRGTGKTTCARLLAKAVNCLDPDLNNRPCNACDYCQAITAGRFMDLIEIDAASNTSVDDVRDLREKINFSPSQGKYKVYIIDEVHMLSTAAFNALLKTLEEPPSHAIFILATTEIHKIPATVLSRCQRHEFRRLPVDTIVRHLKEKSEHDSIVVDEPVFTEIARQATGSLRDAISLLDQLTSSADNVTLEMAQTILGTATSFRVIDIVDALTAKDPGAGMTHIDQALDSGADPRQLARQIVSYLRNVLLYKMDNSKQMDIPREILPRVYEHAHQLSLNRLLQAIEAFNQAIDNQQTNWHPGLGLELAFTAFMIEPAPSDPGVNSIHNMEPASPDQISQQEKQPVSRQSPAVARQKPATVSRQSVETAEATSPKPVSLPQTDAAITDENQPTRLSGELTLDAIQKAWREIKAKVGLHSRRTEALLNTATIAGIKDDTVMLGFASPMLQSMMEKEGNLNITSDILEEVFGRPIAIKCLVTTHEASVLPDNVKIDKDGMIGTATRDLGGKITKAETDQ